MATSLATLRSNLRLNLRDTRFTQIDSADSAWTAASNVTATLETTTIKEGTGSAKLVLATDFTTGVAAYYNLSSELDLSRYGKVIFWIRPSIATITLGQLEIVLCRGTNGAGQVENLDIPAMGTADVWYRFSVDLADPTACTNIVCVGLNATADVGACTVYIDDIEAELSDYKWTDGDLNRSIERALRELSLSIPLQQTSVLKTIYHVHNTDDDDNTVSTADASDQTTANTLLNAILSAYNDAGTHRLSTSYHDNADSTNAIAAVDATSLATSITLANELKLDFNAHRVQETYTAATATMVHYAHDEDNQVTKQDAFDLTTVIALANDLKEKFNNHLTQESNGSWVDVTSLSNLMSITAVEYPIGYRPPHYIAFEHKQPVNRIRLLDRYATADDDDVRVFWNAQHTTTNGLTLDAQYETLLLTGAEAYSLLQYSAYSTNRVNVGDVSQYYKQGMDMLSVFKSELTRIIKPGDKAGKIRVWNYAVG